MDAGAWIALGTVLIAVVGTLIGLLWKLSLNQVLMGRALKGLCERVEKVEDRMDRITA